jgi:hypothetical protein
MIKDSDKNTESNKENQEPHPEPQMLRINGFQQILDMLKVADPHFRESLLARLDRQDHRLAHSLRKQLRETD